ncbi:peptidyl-prolyl cis-trans isomerase FKBP16-1, chloroplastic isoform X2 [Brachypodium distachyon]|uniref:peptidyl-prolyl cis-trans isomerase FKBP16-1, chloroplastic isoform X2 n=1 Tax=Brachypodium distachyon TaxID=15368 RepID=UPI00071CB338|nr:peptidyl-prolyl cis-trans isomerase FKBP16-1, chloroplastic isoform X2 [Brachypodium distachyon]|eukprot:XP_014757095.1 peptidyl-prolyl cis-trans isomerase FKBP16-1, chloroplastic isoform X2 [Brachypodium distachyon]
MELGSHTGFTSPFPCASLSPRCPYPPESKAFRPASRGFRAVCGVSRRRAVSEMAFLGAAASCVNLLAMPIPAQAAMQEPDVIRYRKLDSGVKLEGTCSKCRRGRGAGSSGSTVDQFNGESKPVTLPLDGGEMIRGLKDVIIGMKAGGKRRALIPPEVGYVDESLQPVPEEFGPRRSLLSHAKEPLVFEVQLLKVL